MENHLIPGLGSLRLAELRPAHIQELHATSLKNGRLDGKPGGLSPTTVVQHHRVLSEALSHAAKWDLVPRNAAKSVDPPTKAKPAIRTLDHDEIRRFLDAATDSIYYSLFYLAPHTGLRRSELLGSNGEKRTWTLPKYQSPGVFIELATAEPSTNRTAQDCQGPSPG